MMQYKGYKAAVHFDDEAKILHGEVLGLRDVVTFQAASVVELEHAFHDSVDDYLDFCKQRGEEPERPYSGKFLLRLDPALHRNVDAAASAAGQSVNMWIASVLEVASEFASTRQGGHGFQVLAHAVSQRYFTNRRSGGEPRFSVKKASNKRELINKGSDKRVVQRSASGQVKEASYVVRSFDADRRKAKSKTTKR